jgi:hypothetical protein
MHRPTTKRLLLATALLAASLSATALASNATTLALQAEPSGSLTPTGLDADWTSKGLKISGRIEKQGLRSGRIKGHVDLALLDAEGQVISRHKGSMYQFSPSRRNPDWAAFTATIAQVPADAVAVRVSHHIGGHSN